MNCNEAHLKAQAIIDNELDEKEIGTVIDHMQSCYSCREEYTQLLKLRKKLGAVKYPEPAEEWFEKLAKKRLRRGGFLAGKMLFFGSWLYLAAFFLLKYFSDPSESLWVRFGIGGVLGGVMILLGATVYDRLSELKTDRYKEIVK